MKKLEVQIKMLLKYLRTFNIKEVEFNLRISVMIFVGLVLFYLLFIQSDRYQSLAKVIINQSQPLESGSNNFTSVVTAQRGKGEDAQLVIEYIKSIEMVEYLDYSIDLKRIYSSRKADIFSKLSRNVDKDSLHKYYLDHIKAKLNSDSSILIIEVQSFSAEDSRRILEIIIRRSEEFINKIFHDVAKQQLDFIRSEVLAKEKRILELEKKLRLSEAKGGSSDSKLANNSLRRKVEFAIQAHKESLEGLERVRAESAQNLKKLVVITGPTEEIDATYPKRTYNVLLFLTIFGLAYFIARSTYLTVLTHKADR